jgi:pyruvate/2-oxoglutarate dehydrogenase complex dihydrolipoamide acyltransferase (E2) component
MELLLPQISEDSKEAIITAWHVSEGTRLEKNQDLLEVTTDKATFDIPSPCEGELVKIVRNAGESVKVNEAIAEIKEDQS